ncbi:MAG: triose-phosphate isomerase [Gammaproteobacteria bacterium]|nr:triose-phosphate isomerase [Gammaproteobacteria bacterium]
MGRALVAGNWKLNGSRTGNVALVRSIAAGLARDRTVEVVVCPPFVYLPDLAVTLDGTGIALGAQSVSAEASGAFTGEVSAGMLRDVGCRYAIVGHSERRALYGETDALVARKFAAAQSAGLQPILCVGETLAERNQGATEQVVRRQVEAVMNHVSVDDFATAVIAYEPVWAIGTGQTATPEQAQDVHAFIRGLVAARSGRIAAELRILYGGSVKGSNARALFRMPDIDGGLVGGASLDAADFLLICSAASGSC